jgi:hypothetical protein
MAAIGWVAFGTLCTKVLAESSTAADVMNYTMMAIGVCSSCAALVAIANKSHESVVPVDPVLQSDIEAVKSLAAEARFSESRNRLLALARHMERKTGRRKA